ncbi:Cas10/Cmr2 second palm domain-containing protein [Lihuaxuella thermophila]|uniref:CRISPR-associated protein n=1 Tax=Lihuaxuella thermophila TaxID=1173111 RepID=A0A1H8CZ81_9BACL|nr:type III-B CRISPR-associated protein Cas10/Cmr2 [Lihuaxuella thermophila]SEN00491.1 CRISPR-associated protein [Lihuaxuella thermophila]
MANKIFHFKLIPAKHFILSSELPTDYMSGSFLVSYLVGVAIQKVIEQGGKMILPLTADPESREAAHPILHAIRGRDRNQPREPWIGTIPNYFKAEVPSSFDPHICISALKKTWLKIANSIWEKVIQDVSCLGENTNKIWKKQIRSYWQVYWGFGSEHDAMLRRSLWNTYVFQSETGPGCSMFDHLRELSGHRDETRREKFWKAMNEQLRLQLKQQAWPGPFLHRGSQLSALGLVKRLFPLFSEEIVGWPTPDLKVNEKMSPSALMLIDCDRAGEMISSNRRLSYLLSKFLRNMIRDVTEYGGKVIYAGGDECLIQSPVHAGVRLARILRNKYTWLCVNELDLYGTMSASILLIYDERKLNQSVHYLKWTLKYLVKERYGGDGFIVSSWLYKQPQILRRCNWDDPCGWDETIQMN